MTKPENAGEFNHFPYAFAEWGQSNEMKKKKNENKRRMRKNYIRNSEWTSKNWMCINLSVDSLIFSIETIFAYIIFSLHFIFPHFNAIWLDNKWNKYHHSLQYQSNT